MFLLSDSGLLTVNKVTVDRYVPSRDVTQPTSSLERVSAATALCRVFCALLRSCQVVRCGVASETKRRWPSGAGGRGPLFHHRRETRRRPDDSVSGCGSQPS